MSLTAESGHDQAVAALPGSTEPLLGLPGQRLNIGLLGARTAAALRRNGRREVVDDTDREVLGSAVGLLRAAVEAAEFISSGGTIGSAPSVTGFGSVTFAVTMAAAVDDAHEATAKLRRLLDGLEKEQNGNLSSIHDDLVTFFSLLAEIATRDAGSSGETNLSL